MYLQRRPKAKASCSHGAWKVDSLNPMNHRLFLHCLLWKKTPRRSGDPHGAMGKGADSPVLSGLFESMNPGAVPFVPGKLGAALGREVSHVDLQNQWLQTQCCLPVGPCS